jgi:hypothetical protein
MRELELSLLMGVRTSNFSTMHLVKISRKNQEHYIWYGSGHLEGDNVQKHDPGRNNKKRSEKPTFDE